MKTLEFVVLLAGLCRIIDAMVTGVYTEIVYLSCNIYLFAMDSHPLTYSI